jgi:hypothetical protein
MEYYAAFKKKEIQSFARTWMNMEDILLSEINLMFTKGFWVGAGAGKITVTWYKIAVR